MSRSFRRSPELRVLPGARGSSQGSAREGSRESSPELDGGSFTATALAVQELVTEPSELPGADDLAALSRVARKRQGHEVTDGASGARSSESSAAGERDTRATGRAEQLRLEQLGDAQLVALGRAGDRAAFEVLYRRHAAFALNLAVRIQGRLDDVEDVVHDAFLRAHNQLDRLRDDAAFRGWLASIVVSLVRSRLRRVRLLKTLGLAGAEPIDLDALAADGAGPETRALLAQVYGALRRLPVDQRIAWTLRYVERHSLPDVAAMTDCSLATAKRRISAAQSMLSDVLGDAFAGDDAARDRTGETGGELD
jgi:RNA polymerase sigma-70 factor (ECF subfamily)